jgi:putative hydrolases of HD superfamily
MQTKASNAIAHLQGKKALPIVEAYFEFHQLKQLYRQGWLKRGISPARCESVAEHSFGAAVLAMFLVEAYFPRLDPGKVVRMALLHDFGEIYAGDFTPSDGISAEEKNRLEAQSVRQVLAKLPNGAEYIALWEEYEQQETPEAQFVAQIDRLEMVLQASVYEHEKLTDLSEFFTATEPVLSHPQFQTILHQLQALRRQQ